MSFNIVFFVLFVFSPCPLFAQDFDAAATQMKQGALEEAAGSFSAFVAAHPNDKHVPEALALTGRVLDKLQDALTERYEKKCYWNKGASGSPECMERGAADLTARYGVGAFRYSGGTGIAFIEYTGSHYQQIADRFSKSGFADEAEFYLLLRNLKQHPDIVLPRIQAYLKAHRKGDWHRRGLLLWARVNEDVVYIWKHWTWVVFNGSVSDDDLIIKSEPYRRAAMTAYEQLVKEGKESFEGKVAAKELGLMKSSGSDGMVYGITNDSSPGTWANWGITVP